MEPGICYIFGAGDFTPCHIQLREKDLVIAADGGYDYAKDLGIPVHILIGDFDSISDTKLPADRIVYPPEKDDTDMLLALRYGLEKGYRTFHIYGGLGGRLDHTLANIQTLTFLAKQGATGVLFGEDYKITIVDQHQNTLSLPGYASGYLSIFSLSEITTGVTLKGLKFPLKNATLTNQIPLGVSNQFTGKAVTISIKKGTLAVLWYLPD